MSDSFHNEYPRRQDALRSASMRASDHELSDVISAYAPPDPSHESVLSLPTLTTVGVAVVAALAVAGAVVVLSSMRPQKTAAVEAPVVATPVGAARPNAAGDPCAQQTWPYLSAECLDSKGSPVPVSAAKK